MIQVKLSELEMDMGMILGIARCQAAKEAGLVDRLYKPENAELDMKYSGRAEMAYCKHFNLYPDFFTIGKTIGYEIIHKNGITVNVKWINKPSKNLMTTIWAKEGECHIYALVSGMNPFTIMGWCYEYELLREENIVNVGYGKSYRLNKDKLYGYETMPQIPKIKKAVNLMEEVRLFSFLTHTA
jgi:hypothetical protein